MKIRATDVIPISEDALHISLAEQLRLHEKMRRLNCRWWHTPLTHSSVQFNVKLKKMGSSAGLFDFEFLHDDNWTAWIEVKKKGKKLNEKQIVFKEWLDSRPTPIPNIVIATDNPYELIDIAERFLLYHELLRHS